MSRRSKMMLLFLWWAAGNLLGQSPADTAYYRQCYYTCKIWGYLKYFHSEVRTGSLDWDGSLISTLDSLEVNRDSRTLEETLMTLFDAAGPMQEMDDWIKAPSSLVPLNVDTAWFRDPMLAGAVRSELTMVRTLFRRSPCYWVRKELNGNVDVAQDGYLYSMPEYTLLSRSQRLLGLFRYWNIINYFFPYRNIMDQHWDVTLLQAIPWFVDAATPVEYQKAVMRTSTLINDSHSALLSTTVVDSILGRYYIPIECEYIENRFVVSIVYDESCPLAAGDVILSVDGRPVERFAEEMAPLCQHSNDAWLHYMLCNWLRRGTAGAVELSVEGAEGPRTVTVQRVALAEVKERYYKDADAWYTFDRGGKSFGYVQMGLLMPEDIPTMFEDCWGADALIFNIRAYPNETIWQMVNWLFDACIKVALFVEPYVYDAGMFWWASSWLGYGDFSRTWQKPLYILQNEATISQAEYTIMTLQQHHRAVTVGSQTAGADGDVSLVYLPAGVRTVFTGLGVFFPDSSQTQRIGIIPDIEVRPTIAGKRAGEDEVLEAALDHYFRTSVATGEPSPAGFALSQNYPNPFNPATGISFRLPAAGRVVVTVYDIQGREIAALVNGVRGPGEHTVTWNAADLPSGVYVCRMQADRFTAVRKMALVR
ncbi:T9SS type A sorting domain-containing protein [bacterium]|nr:T9SS type A sorting domain-containing protein [bacterium]